MSAANQFNLSIERYDPRQKIEWDAFVSRSINGTFLFARDYMDYHSDRFCDYSLIARRKDTVVALLPANICESDVYSHQGLTYGGFVIDASMTTPGMLSLFDVGVATLRDWGIRRLHYKTIPSIYHKIPAEQDRYALFRAGAVLTRRDVLSVIVAGRKGPLQARRERGFAKAVRAGVTVTEATDWAPFWAILSAHLKRRHGVDPVHSLAEILLLKSRFPQAIRLFEARLDNEVVAGVVLFVSTMVAHVQYIAAAECGRETGAVDAIFARLIDVEFSNVPNFDFGISNEKNGRHLNYGLIEQKEGFGARAVVHDFYMIDVSP